MCATGGGELLRDRWSSVIGESACCQVLVAGQVLVERAGGDLGVSLAELVDEPLVGVATAFVFFGVGIEKPEADADVPFAGPAHSIMRIRKSHAEAAGARSAMWKARWSS